MMWAPRFATWTKRSVFSALILASACWAGASPSVKPESAKPESAERCPDLTGHYFFPGVDNADAVCPVLTDALQPRFRWPTTSGGFGEWKSKAIVAIRQQGCSSLEFRLLVPGVVPGALTSRFDLEGDRLLEEVEWADDSLTYKHRVKPAPSFTISPVNVTKKTIFFRREPTGALTYRGTYWQATEGRKKVLTECTLRRALPEDWKVVGIEPGGREDVGAS